MGWKSNLREVIIWERGIQGSDQVKECPSGGGLVQGSKG